MRKRARPDASPAADHSIWQGPHELWLSAASVLARVLRNGSLKSILAPMRSEHARPINALVTETLKRRDILERLVDQCGPWKEDSAHELRLLLAHEALFGRGLHQSALQRATEDAALSEALERLRAWETKALKAAKAAAREAGTMPAGATAPEPELSEVVCKLPRYARVNTLKATQDAVVATLAAEGWTLIDPPVPPTDSASHRGGKARRAAIPSAPPAPPNFWVDPHVPSLLVMPPHTELHEHHLVKEGAIILQDKASCLAPAALAPRAGEIVLDCCAAPGNKTTQLAALAAPGGLVIACERDVRRAGVLRKRSAQAAGDAVRVLQTDFLHVQPSDSPFCEVTAVQLDPTCSGSGMVERANFHLDAEADEVRSGGRGDKLAQLAAFQLQLLRHALSFPAARVVVYSTCSVHPVEDELVVAAALADVAVRRAGWRLAPALPAWPCRGLPLVKGHEMLVRAGPEVQTNGFFVARFERHV